VGLGYWDGGDVGRGGMGGYTNIRNKIALSSIKPVKID